MSFAQAGAAFAQAGASVYAGEARAAGHKQRAAALELQSKYNDLQGAQAQAQAFSELDSTLSQIDALVGSRGGSFRAPSAQAVRDRVFRQGVASARVTALGFDANRSHIAAQIADSRNAARLARIEGYIGAASAASEGIGHLQSGARQVATAGAGG